MRVVCQFMIIELLNDDNQCCLFCEAHNQTNTHTHWFMTAVCEIVRLKILVSLMKYLVIRDYVQKLKY